MERIETVFQTRGPEIFKEIKDYSFRSFLGEGSFGAVYKAKSRVTGKYVAMKVNKAEKIRGESSSDFKARLKDEARDFAREAQVLTNVIKGRPNMLQIQDFIDLGHDNRMYIITDLHDGSLEDLVISHKASESVLFTAWRHTLRAINYLGGQGYCHRDIHPGNMFYSYKEVNGKKQILFFLGDFGLTVRTGTYDGKAGACAFRSPEMLREGPSTNTSDVYSAWTTICYCAKIVKLNNRDQKGANFKAMQNMSDKMAKGWKDVVTDRPNRRPTASELLARADHWGSFRHSEGKREEGNKKRESLPSYSEFLANKEAARRSSVAVEPTQKPSARRSPKAYYDEYDYAGPSIARQSDYAAPSAARQPSVRQSGRRSFVAADNYAPHGMAWTIDDTNDLSTVRQMPARQTIVRQPTARRIPNMDYNQPEPASSSAAGHFDWIQTSGPLPDPYEQQLVQGMDGLGMQDPYMQPVGPPLPFTPAPLPQAYYDGPFGTGPPGSQGFQQSVQGAAQYPGPPVSQVYQQGTYGGSSRRQSIVPASGHLTGRPGSQGVQQSMQRRRSRRQSTS